jgi:carbon storage regulator
MLVLGRKVGETLVIADNVRVTILGIEGDRVRVGIDAPRSIPVLRQEILDAVRHENLEAAAAPVDNTLLSQIRRAIGASESA